MSAVAGPMRNVEGFRRPSLSGLMWAVLGGEVLAAVLLWIAGIVLDILAIAPLGGADQWVWLPWRIDGVWAAVGAIGWGYVVCAIVAALVGQSIERRGVERPAAGWLRIAIAISGYGSMAVGRTVTAHVAVAVLAGAVLTRLIAYRRDGSVRGWSWTVTPRLRAEAVLLALVAGLSYSALHPFAADGSGGGYSSAIVNARVGHTEQVDVGLSLARVPVDIRSLTLTGPGADHVSVSAVVLSVRGMRMLIPPMLRRQPGWRHFQGYAWHPTRFPYHLGAGQELWITAQVRLTSCGSASVNTLKLNYTVLGIATAQTLRLQDPLTLRCGG